ncbi:amino acid transporter [Sistotremastrum niveocremeum HHB9708]|uniref:Amino acid transporter n=1 Tax=Sistotremastrum niveocremeum HHB9708 TaxID=1314777 RepID=A0A164WKD6_9AGAM|nr:amino acid transporter [Sistotremastrum niveocremeum HHB9708]
MSTERDALLGADARSGGYVLAADIEPQAVDVLDAVDETGETFDDVPKERRQIGFVSAVFLITNRIIGTGIFATPSIILRSSGSIGMALVLWLAGATVAFAGTSVYLELGTALPRSGGEKVYLEYFFGRPKYLVLCIFATYTVMTGTSSANAVVFGEYLLRALSIEPTPTLTRTIAVGCLTACTILHSTKIHWGLRIQNILGTVGIVLLLFVAFSGILVMIGVIKLDQETIGGAGTSIMMMGGKSAWNKLWEGTRTDANGIVTGLYSVTWSYIGYSNANYALSEIRDPIRTMKRAAPTALLSISLIYFLVNISYFVVVDKEEILNGGQIVASLFFRNIYGDKSEKVLSALIAMVTLGNVLAVTFTTGRIIQELGREAVLPFSAFFSSSKPFGTPMTGLLQQWLVGSLTIVLPPSGDAYIFILNLSSYPYSIINTLISSGLLLLHIPPRIKYLFKSFFRTLFRLRPQSASLEVSPPWTPPFSSPILVTLFFTVSNIFLLVVPFIPPPKGEKGPYENLPYYLHAVTVLGFAVLGVAYWWSWARLMPCLGGYSLDRIWVKGVGDGTSVDVGSGVEGAVSADDGISRAVFRKIKKEDETSLSISI